MIFILVVGRREGDEKGVRTREEEENEKKKKNSKKKNFLPLLPSGPSPPTKFRTHRCTAEPVEPRSGGLTSLTMTAAGARHISDKPNPTSKAANEVR